MQKLVAYTDSKIHISQQKPMFLQDLRLFSSQEVFIYSILSDCVRKRICIIVPKKLNSVAFRPFLLYSTKADKKRPTQICTHFVNRFDQMEWDAFLKRGKPGTRSPGSKT